MKAFDFDNGCSGFETLVLNCAQCSDKTLDLILKRKPTNPACN